MKTFNALAAGLLVAAPAADISTDPSAFMSCDTPAVITAPRNTAEDPALVNAIEQLGKHGVNAYVRIVGNPPQNIDTLSEVTDLTHTISNTCSSGSPTVVVGRITTGEDGKPHYNAYTNRAADAVLSTGKTNAARETLKVALRTNTTSDEADIATFLTSLDSALAVPPAAGNTDSGAQAPAPSHEDVQAHGDEQSGNGLPLGTIGAFAAIGVGLFTAGTRITKEARIQSVVKTTRHERKAATSQVADSQSRSAIFSNHEFPEDSDPELTTLREQLNIKLAAYNQSAERTLTAQSGARRSLWPQISAYRSAANTAQTALGELRTAVAAHDERLSVVAEVVNSREQNLLDCDTLFGAISEYVSGPELANWDLAALYRSTDEDIRMEYTSVDDKYRRKIEELKSQNDKAHYIRSAKAALQLKAELTALNDEIRTYNSRRTEADTVIDSHQAIYSAKTTDSTAAAATLKALMDKDTYHPSCTEDIAEQDSIVASLLATLEAQQHSAATERGIKSVSSLHAAEATIAAFTATTEKFDAAKAVIDNRETKLATLATNIPSQYGKLNTAALAAIVEAEGWGDDVEPKTLDKLKAAAAAIQSANDEAQGSLPRLLDLERSYAECTQSLATHHQATRTERQEMVDLRSTIPSERASTVQALERLQQHARSCAGQLDGHVDTSVAIPAAIANGSRTAMRENLAAIQRAQLEITTTRRAVDQAVAARTARLEAERRAEQQRLEDERRRAEDAARLAAMTNSSPRPGGTDSGE